MSNVVLIRGGTLVNADRSWRADLLVRNGKIAAVGDALEAPEDALVLDATGKLVMPGGVDSLVQLGASGAADGWEAGSRAALAGGTTTLVELVEPAARAASLLEAFDAARAGAAAGVCCDVALAVALAGWDGATTAAELPQLAARGAAGVRAHLGDEPSLRLEDDELLEALHAATNAGLLVQVQAENGRLARLKAAELFAAGASGAAAAARCRPAAFEEEAVRRALTIAQQACAPLWLSPLSCPGAVALLAAARRAGQPVFGSATLLGASHVDEAALWEADGAALVTRPPLRAAGVGARVMAALGGGALACAVSGHRATKTASKAVAAAADFRRITPGTAGVEERLTALWQLGVNSGALDACDFVAVACAAPAQLCGLYPRKGRLEVGADADVLLWDADAERVLSAGALHGAEGVACAFEGLACRGAPTALLAGGRLVLEAGHLVPGAAPAGSGQVLAADSHPRVAFGTLEARRAQRDLLEVIVPREPYQPPAGGAGAEQNFGLGGHINGHDGAADAQTALHSRPATSSGVRNQQDTTFSFGGDTAPDAPERVRTGLRTSVKTAQPPGGGSSGSLW